MAQDGELDLLHDEQDRAFQRKQTTWQSQDDAWRIRKAAQDVLNRARDEQQAAYDIQQAAWERRRAARDYCSQAYEAKQSAYDDQQRAWDELQRLRDNNGPSIGRLREEHDEMFDRIQALSAEIDRAFAWDNREEAFRLIEEVKQLRSDIRDLPPQWRGLSAEISDAKDVHARAAERFRPLQAEFVRLRSIADAAKAEHEAARANFKTAQAACRLAQAEFDATKAEHERRSNEFREAKAEAERTKDAFNRRLAELRAEQEQRKDDKRLLAQQAGVPSQYWDDVWVSIDSDGNVNIYFGGVGEPVGEGHGHYAIDRFGNVTYARDPGDDHGAHNFIDFQERQEERALGHEAFLEQIPPRPQRKDRSTRSQQRRNAAQQQGTLYDRAVSSESPKGARGGYDFREEYGHATQYYEDGTRVSWDLDEEGNQENVHWTDQNVRKGRDGRHDPPPHAR